MASTETKGQDREVVSEMLRRSKEKGEGVKTKPENSSWENET